MKFYNSIRLFAHMKREKNKYLSQCSIIIVGKTKIPIIIIIITDIHFGMY